MIKTEGNNLKSLRYGEDVVGFVRKGDDLVWQHPPFIDVVNSQPGPCSFHVKSNNMTTEQTISRYNNSNESFIVNFADYDYPISKFVIDDLCAEQVSINWLDFTQLSDKTIFQSWSAIDNLIFKNCIFEKNGNFERFVTFDGFELSFDNCLIEQPSNLNNFLNCCSNLRKADLSSIRFTYSTSSPSLLSNGNSFIKSCNSLQEIDISGIDLSMEYFIQVDQFLPDIIYFFDKNNCSNLKKIKCCTFIFYSLYFLKEFDLSSFNNLPIAILNAINTLKKKEEGFDSNITELRKIKNGTHPVFIISDIEKNPEIWDDIN